MAKAQPTAEPNVITFESAMQRIQEIVQTMDGDDLPLEDLIVRYEEGVKLVQICEAKLKSAEKKIETIARQGQGPVTLAEFTPGETPTTKVEATPREKDVRLF